MKKSIETIWKKGFLQQDALIVPQINDLYNQKSIHLVDKFQRTFKSNLIGLSIFSFIMLPLSFLVGLPYMGVPMFFILNAAVIYSYFSSKDFNQIDKTSSSYNYLKSFDAWLKKRMTSSITLYRYLYPAVFLSIFFGFWFWDFGDYYLGEQIIKVLDSVSNNLILIGGFPLIAIGLAIIGTGAIYYFGERLYRADMRAVYGRILDELEEVILEMEELRK